jgi:hypothetical protein
MIQTGLKISADICCGRIYNCVGWVKQRKTQPLLVSTSTCFVRFRKAQPNLRRWLLSVAFAGLGVLSQSGLN